MNDMTFLKGLEECLAGAAAAAVGVGVDSGEVVAIVMFVDEKDCLFSC